MGESIPTGVAMERKGEPLRVPKQRYLSRDVLELEAQKLWPRVWQIACRCDDVREPGDTLEYTIADQIQRGLASRGIAELTLSSMEIRIEHMHRVLDRYFANR